MTYYLIAKNEAGQIVAKRASQSRPYDFATARGTFHSRLDLVPAGQKAYKVEQITAAEFRALSMAQTDTVDRLRELVEKAQNWVEGSERAVARDAERLRAAEAGEIPLGTRTYTAYNPPKVVEGFMFSDDFSHGHPVRLESLKSNLRSSEHNLRLAQTRLANSRKRLATAERKAAKVEGCTMDTKEQLTQIADRGGFVPRGLGYVDCADLDGTAARRFLEAAGFEVIENGDTGHNGYALTKDGILLSTNGYIYRTEG